MGSTISRPSLFREALVQVLEDDYNGKMYSLEDQLVIALFVLPEFDSKNMSNTNKSSQVDLLDHVRYDLRSKINIAYMASSLAAFCITSLVSLIPGEEELEMYRLKLSFRAYVVLSLFSFCAGTAAIVLVELIPITLKSAKAALFSIWVSVQIGTHSFTFDNVYGSGGSPSSAMFEECVAPLVDGLFQGYNATVLAYGQEVQPESLNQWCSLTHGRIQELGMMPSLELNLHREVRNQDSMYLEDFQDPPQQNPSWLKTVDSPHNFYVIIERQDGIDYINGVFLLEHKVISTEGLNIESDGSLSPDHENS
ncbi:hypothetical protein QJS04_geneDACA021340 [Acorus gramineus]|uniref:Kinesin motor domain-containing protein n=1 Tax=Acorus gramineus TaxID=55184 RepID=A0AAV9BM85_ACOGR|nr:hypothetical protein QJS04_geneDACA021340 [Acorus gramineus]